MRTTRSTIGVLVAVVAVLLGVLVPAGADDCTMCTTGELVLLGVAVVGGITGTAVALDDRPWQQRLLPALAVGFVAAALVWSMRIAL